MQQKTPQGRGGKQLTRIIKKSEGLYLKNNKMLLTITDGP